MRLYFEHLPLVMHVGVVLQLRSGLRMADAVFIAAGKKVLHDDAVKSGLLMLRSHSNKEKVESVLLLHQSFQEAYPSERHQMSAALFHSLSR